MREVLTRRIFTLLERLPPRERALRGPLEAMLATALSSVRAYEADSAKRGKPA